MSAKIKLVRKGRKKLPFYRIVVDDTRKARDAGDRIERLGTYNMITKPAILDVDKEKLEYWISKGAQPTESLSKILKRNNIIS